MEFKVQQHMFVTTCILKPAELSPELRPPSSTSMCTATASTRSQSTSQAKAQPLTGSTVAQQSVIPVDYQAQLCYEHMTNIPPDWDTMNWIVRPVQPFPTPEPIRLELVSTCYLQGILWSRSHIGAERSVSHRSTHKNTW